VSTDISDPIVEADAFTDAIAGYAMDVPCIVKDCDREVEWFGNQHGCVRAHMCDFHTMKFVKDVSDDLQLYGTVKCRKCEGFFKTFDSFVKLVRV
jgi:hypothetical protein